jgi:hypothetical protein
MSEGFDRKSVCALLEFYVYCSLGQEPGVCYGIGGSQGNTFTTILCYELSWSTNSLCGVLF